MIKFKEKSRTTQTVVYEYKTDYDEYFIIFDISNRQVNLSHSWFVKTSEESWTPQMSDQEKHSCRFGHWQSDTIFTLGKDELEFIYQKSKELFEE